MMVMQPFAVAAARVSATAKVPCDSVVEGPGAKNGFKSSNVGSNSLYKKGSLCETESRRAALRAQHQEHPFVRRHENQNIDERPSGPRQLGRALFVGHSCHSPAFLT